ncbi:hypothetical protein NV142_004264 [Escherichia coli]|uniref:hypothetical protein n=1 Tax=Escherichia TaxID=561 RepID=UPI00131A424E|nr:MULTISPECIES: hypothetical protein [Escherichia]EFH5431343.1 hypothetical protein [Escherichia coli]EFJ8635624.1 hypothetical protein [Escherichia coli]EFT1922768.1 hypothetical protein [Escherichia coli]EGA6049192.1 hypothetical protein [Escherichia coli]EGD6924337.1 hypothetical protein [Escherichia coli]
MAVHGDVKGGNAFFCLFAANFNKVVSFQSYWVMNHRGAYPPFIGQVNATADKKSQ